MRWMKYRFFMNRRAGNQGCPIPDCESFKTVNPPPPLGINTCNPRRLHNPNFANVDLNNSLGVEFTTSITPEVGKKMTPRFIYRRILYNRFENFTFVWVMVPNNNLKPEALS